MGDILLLAWHRYLQQLERRPLKTKVHMQQGATTCLVHCWLAACYAAMVNCVNFISFPASTDTCQHR
jgi:hypothetical protein